MNLARFLDDTSPDTSIESMDAEGPPRYNLDTSMGAAGLGLPADAFIVRKLRGLRPCICMLAIESDSHNVLQQLSTLSKLVARKIVLCQVEAVNEKALFEIVDEKEDVLAPKRPANVKGGSRLMNKTEL